MHVFVVFNCARSRRSEIAGLDGPFKRPSTYVSISSGSRSLGMIEATKSLRSSKPACQAFACMNEWQLQEILNDIDSDFDNLHFMSIP